MSLPRRHFLALGALAAAMPLGLAPAQAAAGREIDYRRFSDPTRVTNRFFPLVPGAELLYDGKVLDDSGASEPHRTIFTVTDLTKRIHGIRTVVAWDRDYIAGELGEAELAFFAQDDAGTVWNLGEYPEEFEEGEPIGAPSTWIDGYGGARGGRHMLAAPRAGTPAYTEGYVPSIEFFDRSKVLRTGLVTRVPAGRFTGVLEVDEWSPLDPESGHQQKYYAPDVGLVRVGASGGEDQEFLTLTRARRLGRTELAEARAAARAMDRRAYVIAAGVYRHTEPVVQRPG